MMITYLKCCKDLVMVINNTVDFLIGAYSQLNEEKDKFVNNIKNEYDKILELGVNNNSEEAIAIRETTDLVFSFIDELKDSSK